MISKALFFLDSKIESTSFNSTNLNNIIFYKCILNLCLVHKNTGNEWYKGLTFNACEFIINNINWQDIRDISLIYLWDFIDLSILRKLTDQRFTVFQTSETKLLYGIDAKTIWWQPLNKEPLTKYKPHRFSVEEFLNEVYNDFPTTDVYPYMEDYEVEFELAAFCEYIQVMHKNVCDIESRKYSW
ncbi:hypothetical protein C7377_1520 [Balneicella halophila]|uniref:Uncharacterized protein n=1 Tax=Balneicella halophila TaxID=1537566 RepID=A0A7L4UMW8_BALHA|nr:hypothetical protein [Balneicella halophila]PVX49882.1 hypothetical protein C7377_1520 [Balneicella halophila]